MPIQKLEDSTVRVLGASQTLTDPTSLVKELVDNALDAHSTSVAIEISADTLASIQVRDNGHGIAPEDRALVARPNCTSKITSDDDIKSVRGSSLGFRGQALASAAELSGSLIISTRVEGEQTATTLVISQTGEVTEERRASLAVGTTVKIAEFVAANPVRKQVLLKSADKTLRKLKELLQSYAFARPKVRFALRVTKAKSEKNNFLYVPRADSTIDDVAMKLLGSACSAQCRSTFLEADGMTLTAYLPNPAADVKKVTGLGSFISVDGRPVSPKRGTLKQVVTVFRGALRAVNHAFQNAKDIFLYLDISCSSMAYDPNIEPAKDDVLFEHPDTVIQAARTLFAAVYEVSTIAPVTELSPAGLTAAGLQMGSSVRSGSILQPSSASSLNARNLSLMKAPRTPSTSTIGTLVRDHDAEPYRQPTMNDAIDELDEIRQANRSVQTSNPWVHARLNAPNIRTRKDNKENSPPQLQVLGFEDDVCSQLQHSAAAVSPALPTPRATSPIATYEAPYLPHLSQSRSSENPTTGSVPSGSLSNTSPSPYPSSLPPQGSNQPHVWPSSPPQREPTGTGEQAQLERRGKPRRGSGRPFQGYPKGGTNRPFKPPVRAGVDGPPLWFGREVNNTRAASSEASSPIAHRRRRFVPQGEPNDAVFETRTLSPPQSNRDIREFVGSIDLTEEPLPPVAEAASDMAEGDGTEQVQRSAVLQHAPPRARTRRISRRKSSGQALERVPAGKRMHNVVCHVKTSMDDVADALDYLSVDAIFAARGDALTEDAIKLDAGGIGRVVSMLRVLLSQRSPAEELVVDFDQTVGGVLSSVF